jgi:carbonic anhydrase/acetyltransferase-like protein (isoleucine patch superfamily)
MKEKKMKEGQLQTLKYKAIPYKGQVPEVHSIFVAPNCFLIGNVLLKEGSSIWFGATLRGDTDRCELGEGSSVMENSFVENSIIGDQSMISHGAIVHKCTIGDNVIVGIGARIINGAKIGNNTIIGAGAIILPLTEIPSNSVVIDKGKILRGTREEDLKFIQESVQEVQEKARILKENLTKPSDY